MVKDRFTTKMGALLQILLKALPSGPSPQDSDNTAVEVRVPILCCITVTVDETAHQEKEEHKDEHRSGVGR